MAWDPQFKGGYSDQSWMYGIALEAMAQASWTFERTEMPGYMRRAADWVFANPKEWDPATRRFFYVPGAGGDDDAGLGVRHGDERRDRRYWDIAIEGFQRQTGEQDATDRHEGVRAVLSKLAAIPLVPLRGGRARR